MRETGGTHERGKCCWLRGRSEKPARWRREAGGGMNETDNVDKKDWKQMLMFISWTVFGSDSQERPLSNRLMNHAECVALISLTASIWALHFYSWHWIHRLMNTCWCVAIRHLDNETFGINHPDLLQTLFFRESFLLHGHDDELGDPHCCLKDRI